jgi:oxygen-independent coproporphyrinogen-3 oxidase
MAAASTLALLKRYDRPGPRYTSYPTAVEFHDGVGHDTYRRRLRRANGVSSPLSFYAHLPFCEARCSFCGCNVIVTPHRGVAARYLDDVGREIDLLARALPDRRTLSQMHWGGGTPTYYTPEQLSALFGRLTRHFTFTSDAEIGIEVDPRVTSPAHLETLRALGFNRLSMGVQDFDPQVQAAVNRIQSYELTRDLIDRARALGFQSINIDLIYGLPFQTVHGFRQTIDQALMLRPDRVAAYSFAFVPWMKAHMNRLSQEALPPPGVKLELLALTIDAFHAAGYRQIGLDHFALPGDELARAIDTRALHRNFMGYTVQTTGDMVAVGVSGIGEVQGAFVQNTKKLPEYHGAIDAGRFPIERGYEMSRDDLIRRHVITALMCHWRVDIPVVERRFGIAFDRYFAAELGELTGADSPEADGLIAISPDRIDVTPLGRLFVRNVCMVFDRYLRARTAGPTPVFSRTV